MIRFEDIYETVKSHHPEADLELPAQGLHLLRRGAQGADPCFGRALPRPPARRWRRSWPRCAWIRPAWRRPAPRRARGHPHRPRAHQGVLRPRRPAHRRGRHQDQQDPVLVLGGAPGRELPQAAAGHGRRHSRDPGEARRPTPQHAHAPAPARGAASEDRARDDGHLRPARGPAGDEQDQERARGPLLPVPRARGLQGSRRRGSRSAARRRRPSSRS